MCVTVYVEYFSNYRQVTCIHQCASRRQELSIDCIGDNYSDPRVVLGACRSVGGDWEVVRYGVCSSSPGIVASPMGTASGNGRAAGHFLLL